MQIKKAYIELITKYHPDIYKGDKVFAQKYTAIITEAYSVLKDPDRRQQYDIKHNFVSKPNYRTLRREDKQIVRARRKMGKKQNAEQEISREYFKNADRKESKPKRGGFAKLMYSLLALIAVEVVVAIIIYFK